MPEQSIEVTIAVLSEQMKELTAKLSRLELNSAAQWSKLETKVDAVSTQVSEATNRWRGGLAVVLGAAGFVGFMIATWKGLFN